MFWSVLPLLAPKLRIPTGSAAKRKWRVLSLVVADHARISIGLLEEFKSVQGPSSANAACDACMFISVSVRWWKRRDQSSCQVHGSMATNLLMQPQNPHCMRLEFMLLKAKLCLMPDA